MGKKKKMNDIATTKISLRQSQKLEAIFVVNQKLVNEITSQCHPPSPTAFLTTPRRPTRTDLVRLFPVTTTLV